MPERCPATKPWVRPHTCEKFAGHHGEHVCGCGEHWLNEDNWTPCVATVVATLGVVGGPATLRCGLQDDHGDDHLFTVSWSGPLANLVPGDN